MDLDIRALRRPEEVGPLVELLEAAYAHVPPGRWAAVQASLDADPRYTRVGLIQGRLVSTVQVLDVSIGFDGRPLRVGGIAHVATRPDAGASYAIQVLRDAVALLRQEGFRLSMLHTAIPRYYNRQGWWTIPEHLFTIDLPASLPPVSGSCQIDVYEADRDLASLVLLHARSWAGLNGPRARRLRDWQTGSPWEPDDPARWLVARRGPTPVGYVRARAGSFDVISELIGEDVEAAQDLFLSVLARCAAGGARRVYGKFPLSDELAGRLSRAGLRVERRVAAPVEKFEVTMFRFLDVAGFFAEVRDRFQRRLLAAGRPRDAAVSLVCPSGQVVFQVFNGRLLVRPEAPELSPIRLTDAELLELTLGARRAGDVAAFAALPAAARNLLEALFPGRPVVFWLPDHF